MFFSQTVPWDDEQLPSHRPSIGKRILRTVVRFSFVFLIGAGTTLAWQSDHEEGKEIVRTWVPSLGWLLPPSPTMAEPSSDLGQQLKPLSFDLALVRRSLEQLAADQKQLAAKQEEIAHDVATLQAVERDFRQNISSGLRLGHSRSCATNPRNLRRSPWLCSKRQPFWELKDQVSNINDQRIVKRRAP